MKYKSNTAPRDHQLKNLKKTWSDEVHALFHEQGTGKTKIAIDTAGVLFCEEKIDALLVIAPNGVQRQWILEQIPKHLGSCVPRLALWYKRTGGKKTQAAQQNLLLPNHSLLRILAINYEALLSKTALDYVKGFLRSGRTLMVLDESHRIRNMEAAVTKTLLDLSDKAKVRRIMTGTPAPENPLELFSQMRFLDTGILQIQSYSAFRARYAEVEPPDSGTMFAIRRRIENKHRHRFSDPAKLRSYVDRLMPKIVCKDADGRKQYKNLDELKALIAPFSSRVLKADCTDLPPKQYAKLFVELSSEQRRVYDELKYEFLAEYEGNLMTAPMVLARLTRLQQITGGFFMGQDGTEMPFKENPKLDALLEYAEDVQGKVIIWARFVPELRIIADSLASKFGPNSVARYWGEVGDKSRDENKKRFIRDEGCRFFVGQPKSGGTGTDGLQVANNALYFSNERALIDRLQSEDRGHRDGLMGTMIITDIAAIDTLDIKIIDSLRDKKELTDLVMGDPPKNWI